MTLCSRPRLMFRPVAAAALTAHLRRVRRCRAFGTNRRWRWRRQQPVCLRGLGGFVSSEMSSSDAAAGPVFHLTGTT